MTEAAPTPDLTVARTSPEAWRDLRAVRLSMLLDTPLAFGSTYAREAAFTEATWRERAAGLTWMARSGDLPVGSVTLFRPEEVPADEIVLVGMWVAAHARGGPAAAALVDAAVLHARGLGLRRVLLDVAEQNTRAAAFYRRLGFRPTGRVGVLPHSCNVSELEMALALDG
ncbi:MULTISPECIES: GNAT family N-acetyltransferase [unclassified Janibacter]|uniref:GNAT family N-acetyltransferase n=1 Tax=unclassified Janibacter TaxID=2649294 RepID=UPI003D05F1CF